MADYFNLTGLPEIPTASSTTAKGAYKALTPLQKEADAKGGAIPVQYSGPTSPSLSEYKETDADKASRVEARTAIEAELQATPFKDAFKESFGGYVRDIMRVSNKAEGAKGVDPSYDVGEYRQNFRSIYGEEHWGALERTRNKSQYDALITNLDAKAKHDEVLGRSTAGTIVGSLFDPIGVLSGGVFLKGAMTAAKAYRLGKTVPLAASALGESALYGGIEAGVQNAEFGEVYNPSQVYQTMAITAALHFGVGAVATSKADFMGKAELDEHLGEGDKFIQEARAGFAAHAQQKAEDLANEVIKPEDLALKADRHFTASAYPVQTADREVAVDSLRVEASTPVQESTKTNAPLYIAHGTNTANKQSIVASGKFEINDANRQYSYSELGPDTVYFTSPKGWWLDKEQAANGRASVYEDKVLAEVSPDANLVTLNSPADAEAFAQSLGYPSWEKLPFFVDGMTDGVESAKRARDYYAPLKAKLEEKGIDGLVISRDFDAGPETGFSYPAKDQVAVFNLSKVKPVADDTPIESALVDGGSAANTSRVDALSTPIIKSESTAIQDTIDLFTASDAATRSELSEKALKYFETPIGKLSAAMSNTLQGFSSASPIVREAARVLGADSTGIFRNIERPTAYDKSAYNKLIRHHFASTHDEYKAWAQRNGKSGFTAELSTSLEVQWNKQLRNEMEARWNTKDESPEDIKLLDAQRWSTIDPEIKRAADAIDAGNQVALDLMKKHNVLGAEGLNNISRGYIPRRMDGRALQDLHRLDPAKYEVFKDALGTRYHKSFVAQQAEALDYVKQNISTIIKEDLARRTDELTKTFKGTEDLLQAEIAKLKPTTLEAEIAKFKPITAEKSKTIAEGVMRRAIDRASGIDGSTIGLFDKAARNEIESILKSKGMDYSELEHTFAMLDKTLGKRTGSNRLKGRMEIDINTPDEVSGINFLDYFDNDLNRLTTSYAEEMSGRIALARQGIGSDNDFENIVAAIRNENKSLDVEKDIQLIRDMHSVLLGRPLKGQGESKFIQLMTQLNPLQSLGQVGVAQGAESSLSVAQLGLGAVLKAVPMAAKIVVGARKNLLNADDLRLLKDVESLNGPVGESWRIHRPRTEVLERLNADGSISHAVDKMLKAGQHVNGFVSFMHQVMEAQLKTVAVMGTRKFAKDIQNGVLTPRLADAGFNQSSINSIKRTLDEHAVFKNGQLHDLNLSKWSADDAEHFMRNIERLSGQLIQQDFAGEAASWMHKDLGRMFLSLRGYSIKAFNKQLIRNVNIGDAVAAQAVVYGMFFSTLGYTAKMHLAAQFREDKEEFLQDRLSGASLAQGAMSYMAFSSFVPELLRPLASWYGEGDDSHGVVRSGSNAVVAAIPGLAPLDRAFTMVGNAGSSIVGGKDYTAKHARQAATTLLGNSFPVTLAINAAVDDDE